MAAKSAARRRAPPRNAFLRLRRREVFGQSVPFARKIYAAIPARLASPVATLVDAPRAKLLECVLLGFTADGDHLVSYAALDGGRRYELQMWTFRPRTRCTLVASVPLFTQSAADAGLGAFGVDARGEDGIGGDLVSDFARDAHLRITVCESADGSTLLVHGEPAGGRRFGDTEAPMARRCFLSAVPSPAFFSSARNRNRRGEARPPLGATSMSYLSTSARPFDPRIAGCVPAAESGDMTCAQYAVLNSGDALIGVRVAPAEASADDDDPTRSAAGPILEALLSVSEGPTAVVRWAPPRVPVSREGSESSRVPETLGRSALAEGDGSFDGSGARRVMSMRSWTAMEADAVLSRALAATLRAGYCLVDYEVHLLDVAHGAEGARTSAVAAVVSVLRARDDVGVTNPAPSGRRRAPRGSEGWRTVVSVVEIPPGAPPPPPPRLLFSVEVPPAPESKNNAAAVSAMAGPSTLRAVAAARARLAALRRAAHVPSGAPLRAGATLTNAVAVATGMSAEALKHPTQPICVVGWNGIGRGGAR